MFAPDCAQVLAAEPRPDAAGRPEPLLGGAGTDQVRRRSDHLASRSAR